MKMKKLKLKVTIGVDGQEIEHLMQRNRYPNTDAILGDFSYHYHKGTRRNLPPTAKILNVEVLNDATR
jgi:hypothetical protein